MGTRTWLGRTIPLRGLPTPHLSKQKVLAEWLSETGPAAWSRLGPERTGPVAGRSVVLFLEVQVPEDRADGSEGLWVILPAAAAAAARMQLIHPCLPDSLQELGRGSRQVGLLFGRQRYPLNGLDPGRGGGRRGRFWCPVLGE